MSPLQRTGVRVGSASCSGSRPPRRGGIPARRWATTSASVEIEGRRLTLPVRIRDGDSWSAQFLVPVRAAQAIVAPTGLEVARLVPRRAAVSIAFATYRDTDLGPYDEAAIAILVRRLDAKGGSVRDRLRELRRQELAIYVHRLFVTQAVAAEAHRTIWGYPSAVAEIAVARRGGRVTCSVEQEGARVLAIAVREGGPLKTTDPNLPNFSVRDGVLRVSAWDQEGTVEARLGGVTLELGSHPIADELRSLDLSKRALFAGTMRGVRASLGSVVEIGARP